MAYTINNAIINDVLCYLSTSKDTIPAAELIVIVHGYYDQAKISSAKTLLCQVSGLTSTKRRAEDKIRMEIRDMLDLFEKIEKNKTAMPKFLAERYDSLPPSNGFSLAARNMVNLLDRVDQLNRGLDDFFETKNAMMEGMADQADLKAEISEIKVKINKIDKATEDKLLKIPTANVPLNQINSVVVPTMAQMVARPAPREARNNIRATPADSVQNDGRSSGNTNTVDRKNETRRRPNQGLFGTRNSQTPGGLRGSRRPMDLYIGRCELDTTVKNVIDHCKSACNIDVIDCSELIVKSSMFKAFKISVTLRERNILLDPECWPEGVVVRKFYKARVNMNNSQNNLNDVNNSENTLNDLNVATN